MGPELPTEWKRKICSQSSFLLILFIIYINIDFCLQPARNVEKAVPVTTSAAS